MTERRYIHHVNEYDGFKVGDLVVVTEDLPGNEQHGFKRVGFVGTLKNIQTWGGAHPSYCISDNTISHGYFWCDGVGHLSVQDIYNFRTNNKTYPLVGLKTNNMKHFSIDLKNSEKGERKKAVKYLKKIKYRYWNARRWKDGIEYAYLNIDTGDNTFFYSEYDDPKTITLPKDWNLLIEYTQKETHEVNLHLDVVNDYLTMENFKVGDWVKITTTKKNLVASKYYGKLARIIELNIGTNLESVHKTDLEYVKDSYLNVGEDNMIKASPEEIKEHLIKEAKERGLTQAKVRVKTLCERCDSHWINDCSKFYYNQYSDKFTAHDNVLYLKGQWAEIIKEEPFKINGHEVKSETGNLHSVGCVNFTTNKLDSLIDDIQCWKTVAVDISIKVKGEDVSYEDLLKLKQYLDSKS